MSLATGSRGWRLTPLPSQALPTWLVWLFFSYAVQTLFCSKIHLWENIYTWGFSQLGMFFKAGRISGNTSSSRENEKIAFQMKSPQDIVPERGLITFIHFIKCFSARYKSFFLVAVRLLPQPYGTQTLGSGVNLFCPVPALVLLQPCGCGDTEYHCREKEGARERAVTACLAQISAI